ncbi:MAG: type II toxin-antitoxin system prevent-host-death family antitoxin [Gammaproteobacteria bacterium]|nr:type II toxin-antitoxin system prevent-host-death family antitoxin [Gammaproteobacteria bacterium]
MIRANISELRNGLSAYLRSVRRGESVLILDRDVPIARLTPVEGAVDLREERTDYVLEEESREVQDEARVARLVAAGVLSRPRRGGDIRAIVRGWDPLPGGGLVEALLEMRREDREKGYR